MKSTIQVISEQIETDDILYITRDSQEANLKEAVENKDIDGFLIALCGWSWKTIQHLREKR